MTHRVTHKFGFAGQLVTGNIRQRDKRVLVQCDDGEKLWCAVELLQIDA